MAAEKSKEAMDDLTILNGENMQSNMKVINYSRTFMSIIAGVMAGIIGFNGVLGFVFYAVVMAVTSLGLAAKAKFSIHSYFDGWNRVLLDGFLGGLMSFVLFWTSQILTCVLILGTAVIVLSRLLHQ